MKSTISSNVRSKNSEPGPEPGVWPTSSRSRRHLAAGTLLIIPPRALRRPLLTLLVQVTDNGLRIVVEPGR
jgi:hypothetical protein